jgi:uncharacterized glyoxalase superfamily protein PhnB
MSGGPHLNVPVTKYIFSPLFGGVVDRFGGAWTVLVPPQ